MKNGILVVSFGTTYEEARKLCIESIENKIRNEFKDFEVRRAFTSNMVIKKLKERDNLYIDTVEEALEKFEKEGFEEVYIQSLHIIPGHEYEKIAIQVDKYNEKNSFNVLKLSQPLLYNNDDYYRVIEVLDKEISTLNKNKGLILMGHGTDHKANECYRIFEERLRNKGFENVYMGTVEGYQPIDEIIPLLKKNEIKKVKLQPFMLVAGDHVLNDMVGDEHSWKAKLEEEGFEVEAEIKGLGEKAKFQEIFINNLRKSFV